MPYEDWTSVGWVELDPGADITRAANTINIVTLIRNITSYVSKSYGADYFGDFCHDVDIYLALIQARAGASFWAMDNSGNRTYKDMEAANSGFIAIAYADSGGTPSLQLYDQSGVGGDSYVCTVPANYYLSIERAGTALTEKIYSDAARTVLLDTLSVTCETGLKEYLYSVTSWDQGTYPGQYITFDVHNLDLICGEEEEEEGPSTATFTIAGETETVYLTKPSWSGEENEISKDIDRKSFWSGNYSLTDKGIIDQPVVLRGIEYTNIVNSTFTNKMKYLIDMSNENEEVTITGLGDCMDGVYIMRSFHYETIPKTVTAYAWVMTLEKVRDI